MTDGHNSSRKVQQNKILEAKIQRDPSRVAAKVKKLDVPTPGGLAATAPGPGTSAIFGSNLGTSIFSTSLGPSPSYGPQMFLRIRVLDTADAVHISTTIPVYVTSFSTVDIALTSSIVPQLCTCRKHLSSSVGSVSCRIPRNTHYYWVT